MTGLFTLGQAAEATGGALRGDDLVVEAVSTDTREIGPGSLYVPLKGERFDGHDFVDQAIARGAIAVVADRPVSVPDGVPVLQVDQTLLAYGKLARLHRRNLGLTVVAVTGSSGKTSTKEVVAELLGRFVSTAKSHANYNNEIGVPKTLLELRAGPRCVVLEMGMRGPGEIAYLADVARPDIGVVTNIGTAHIGRLGSQEAIARAKGELIDAIPHGRAVLNFDDPFCRTIGRHHPDVCWYSAAGAPQADMRARSDLRLDGDHWVFEAAWRETAARPAGQAIVRLPLPGTHHVSNALAAMSVAWHLELPLPEDLTLAPPSVGGRSRVVAVGDVEILDESYNANPESARAALDAFCKLPCAGRRVVVFGEMAELGDFADQAHRDLGRTLDSLPVDLVVTVGDLGRLIAEGTTRQAASFGDNGEAVRFLGPYLRSGDRLLVKGSRAGRLEEIVAGLAEWLE